MMHDCMSRFKFFFILGSLGLGVVGCLKNAGGPRPAAAAASHVLAAAAATTTPTMAAQRLAALDFEVFGRVQGVFFRKYTKKKAVELGIRGWCKNTEEKTVTGQLEGPHRELSVMKDWLQKTGSPSSRIDKAEFKNEKEIDDYSFKNFSIRH